MNVTKGTIPEKSSATFKNSGSNGNDQLTSGNTMTLTLSGYSSKKITGITLSMKSNSKAGAGYLSVTAGETTLASIGSSSSGVAFSNASWNGSYTTSFTDVTPTMSNSSYAIQNGENVVIVIGATTNSLYCQSFKISYEDVSGSIPEAPEKELIGIQADGTPAEFWKGDAFNHKGMTITALWDDESETDVTSSCEFTGYDMSTHGQQTVTVTYQGETTTYGIEVKTIANTQADAYTVTQAKALIDAGKDLATEVYVKGTVSQIDSYNRTYGSITYWISEDGTTTNQFEVYSGKNINNTEFSAKEDLTVGDDVIVYGIIKKYSSTYEFDKNNYIVSIIHQAPPTITALVVSGTPTKTTYNVGDEFETAGLTVTATYSDETTAPITTGFDWEIDYGTGNEAFVAGATSVDVIVYIGDDIMSEVYTVNGLTVNVPTPRPADEIFYESFDTNNGTGGNDDQWSGNIATNNLSSDNTWTFVKGNGAKECAKFGAGSALGSATTPALGVACEATLTFKAAAWNGSSESTTLKLSVLDGGTVNPSTVTLTKGAWGDFEVTLTGLTASSKIKFEGNATSNSRFFLDEVSIVQVVDTDPIEFTPATLTLKGQNNEGYWATFSSSEVTFFPNDYEVFAAYAQDGKLGLYSGDTNFEEGIEDIGENTIIDGFYVPANTGILVNSLESTVNFYTVKNFIPENYISAYNMLHASSETLTGDYTYYKFSNGDNGLGFYWGAEDGGAFNSAIGKAYLAIPGGSHVKAFSLSDIEDAISEVKQNTTINKIYNLQGQRVDKTQKGLYIINGRKVVK